MPDLQLPFDLADDPDESPDTGTPDTGTPDAMFEEGSDRPPAQQLTNWLCGLVWSHDYGRLAELRRPEALTEARFLAEGYAPEDPQRPVFARVAFLFARYHAGRRVPQAGYGSMGDALRRIGTPAGRGSKDPGARRLFERLVAARELPLRHLQHAVERARACEVPPPSWSVLTVDLVDWKSRDRQVPYEWARAFYTPAYPAKKNG
ncbi:type I-E CRISPR-associated protein Cse2/CasB [Kitasatospora sp. NPDC056651]|uniref:type I-E CRISPR-associated protein Cse2/CasB n=1 Tax=Kitasatospora sp. NPDC056651 TaxID=3345892 RepID=UPI0036ACD308